MSTNHISTSLVQKLGHRIEEIRLRALKNIISKFEFGLLRDCDLRTSKDIIVKLFEWFSFEPCSEQDTVLKLILKILKSETGALLIKFISPDIIISDLKQIQPCLPNKYVPYLREIISYIESYNQMNRLEEQTLLSPGIPPLNFVSPRSENQNHCQLDSDEVHTTATPIDIFVHEDNSNGEIQHGVTSHTTQRSFSFDLPSMFSQSQSSTPRSNINIDVFERCLPNLLLSWQPLISPDRHVLSSIENSLENATDSMTLLHSCRFFTDVLLQDFPAEIFLQRPTIVKLFHGLLNNCQSNTVVDAVVNALQKLTELLYTRVKYYRDPSMVNYKQEKCVIESKTESNSPKLYKHFNTQDNYFSQASNEVNSNSTDRTTEIDLEDSVLLQIQQLTLPHYCIQTLYYTFVRISAKPASVKNFTNRQISQEHMNGLILLIVTLLKLIQVCIKPEVWEHQNDHIINEVTNQLTLLFNKLAIVLENSRLLSFATDMNPNIRVTHLLLVCITKNFLKSIVPDEKAYLILPSSLKNSIANCLLDAAFLKLYPHVHTELMSLLNNSSENSLLSRYKDVEIICNSLKVAAKFLRKEISTNSEDVILAMIDSVPSLEYHKNMSIIKIFWDILINKYQKWKCTDMTKGLVEELIVSLLGHSDINVKITMYKTCHMYIANVLGTDHITKSGPGRSGECLKFFWNSTVLIEIVCHGLNSDNAQIQRYAEDIIHYILKCKFLVTPEIWDQILIALIPALPILQCYADKTSPLDRSITKIIDPDVAENIRLPKIEVIKGNLRMAFSKNAISRNEAISRLTWLLSTDDDSQNKLPLLKSLRGPIINSLCIFDNPVSFESVNETSKHFYQVSSLLQVLELLSSNGVEAKIRKSACTQLSAMMEESDLHKTFLEYGGLKLIMDIFKSCLQQNQYENYPDSAIPIIRILKNLAINNPKIRHELSIENDIYLLITRAIFLFVSDENFRQDAAILLCLLLFSDFILGGNSKQLSIVYVIAEKLSLPIKCRTHWRVSKYAKTSLSELFFSDESCAATLRIQWNIAWYGGLREIFKIDKIPSISTLTMEQLAEFNGNLRLTKFDLASLKYSSIFYCCQKYLDDIQNASSHQAVIESITGITAYLSLRKILNNIEDIDDDGNIFDLSWEGAFSRFLASSPSSSADMELLVMLLYFLRIHMKFFKKSETPCWITSILKDPNHCLLKLLYQTEELSNSAKNLNKELLLLITECASIEQRVLDMSMFKQCIVENKKQKNKTKIQNETWIHVVQAIAENLNFNDTQHFYNLAFLDWRLNCLVQITANLGWSESGTNHHGNSQELRGVLVGCLTELVGAFHCGKGPAAATSFMGLSITRNSVLTMNHLLCEMQNVNEGNWEKYWLCETGDMNGSLQWLGTLWTSRDVILRAATLQLLAGLASSQRGATEVILGLRSSCSGGVWTGALSILLDNNEASTVREQAAILLTHLTNHNAPLNGSNCAVLTLCYGPDSCLETNSTVEALLALLEKYNFFSELDTILSYLNFDYEIRRPSISELCNWKKELNLDKNEQSNKNNYMKSVKSIESDDEDTLPSTTGNREMDTKNHDVPYIVVTPSLVKAIAWFVTNLLTLDPEAIVNELNNNMLIKSFARCLTIVNFDIKDSRSLVLYIDILEMCSAVCTLLTKAASNSAETRSIVLHLRNCLYTLISIFNSALYYTNLSHLLYLRNRLWSQVFKFLTALLISDDINSCYRDRGYNTISIVINEVGYNVFLDALCESISSSSPDNCVRIHFTDLQQSAVTSLTSLLRLEVPRMENTVEYESNIELSPSLQEILDTVRTSHQSNAQISPGNNNENISPVDYDDNQTKLKGRQHSKNRIHKKSILKTNLDSNIINTAHDENIENVSKKLLRSRNKSKLSQTVAATDNESVGGGGGDIGVDTGGRVAGAELCQMLIRLYNMQSIKNIDGIMGTIKGKTTVMNALTSLLCVSKEAKKTAVNERFLELMVQQLKELHVQLSLEPIECIRKISSKKRVCPLLNDMSSIFKLLTNFMLGDEKVKLQAVSLGLADLIHKLWNWINFQKSILIEVLRMLCTFTNDCEPAAQSICLTSPVAGIGPRKTPTTVSLLHCAIHLIGNEMDLVSRTHELNVLSLAFHLMQNCCQAQECRILIAKSNLFQHLNRVHPAITKGQKPWESVELIWLEFLEVFTFHPEGQISVAKSTDTMELIMALTSSVHEPNKMTALAILRNITFCQSNRPRLLSSDEFLQILNSKLSSGSIEEKCICITIIWSLAANNQKAKYILKTSGLESRLQHVLKQWKLSESNLVPKEELNNLQYILEMLKEGR